MPHAISTGDLIDGRYRVISLLAEGGMGAVFLAEHMGLSKEVALKVIHKGIAGDGDMRARFAREAMASAQIDHPHVASTLDIGALPDGSAYLVMPLIRGPSLADTLDSGPMPWPRAVSIGAQIADALEAAHAAGIVHRDLKPDNVVLTARDDGRDHVKVLDFGIAGLSGAAEATSEVPLTRAGVVMGTPGYMSPEQAVGEVVDLRTDLYALGVILWESVVGRRLFDGPDITSIITRQLTTVATPIASLDANVPPELDALVSRLLSPSRDQRPSSAGEVRDVLVASLPAMRPSLVDSLPTMRESFPECGAADRVHGPRCDALSIVAPAGTDPRARRRDARSAAELADGCAARAGRGPAARAGRAVRVCDAPHRHRAHRPRASSAGRRSGSAALRHRADVSWPGHRRTGGERFVSRRGGRTRPEHRERDRGADERGESQRPPGRRQHHRDGHDDARPGVRTRPRALRAGAGLRRAPVCPREHRRDWRRASPALRGPARRAPSPRMRTPWSGRLSGVHPHPGRERDACAHRRRALSEGSPAAPAHVSGRSLTPKGGAPRPRGPLSRFYP
ncbi:MAG: serine/threonine protein kinase [Sandaracinaceae bacterium]|nr:serine/threonine protein kinase [Sandaracinaceae bacterium]